MKSLGLILLSFLFLGCSSVAIRNIENVAITPTQSTDHVKKVITEAATARGWKVSEKNSKTMRAQLFVRRHEVVVDIAYSGSSFSILYVDSKNMRYYNGETIHRKYMAWIERLRSDILRKM